MSEEHCRITRSLETCGNSARITGTRITVWQIIAYSQHGVSTNMMLVMWPHLTTADLEAAIAYYEDHKEEIDREIQENR